MKYFAGIDVGSLSADAVLIDSSGNTASFSILPTGSDSRAAGRKALTTALKDAGLEEADLGGIVSTGYSRERVQEASSSKTEITCHARGAAHVFPDTGLVIDIGGQDSKTIRLGIKGKVLDFAMNDKCAAGTGRFLEVMANALGVEIGNMAGLAENHEEEVSISSTCTVFAESEVVSLISVGTSPADIAFAICRAVAHRTAGLASRVGLIGPVVMTGGVAKNKAVVAALSEKINLPILVPHEPQIIGALGAALFALDEAGE